MATTAAVPRPVLGAPDLRAGLYRLADPKITLASAAGLFLATCAAASRGPLDGGWLAVVVIGIFAVEVAKNASGEIFDWDSGADQAVAEADRTPFSGGKRVLVDGLLTRAQTAWIAAAFYAIAVGCGLAVAVLREPRVAFVGLAGLACAWFYHAPPLALAYRGGGELAVGLCYGPLIVAGSYLALRGDLVAAPLMAALPLGLLVAAFLWVNELPDATADAAAGKRTLVVRLGRERAARGLGLIFAAAFTLLLALPLLGAPWQVLFGLVGLPAAWRAGRLAVGAGGVTSRLVPAQVATLAAFLLYAAGAGIGLLLAGGPS
jgi:1,4-dihydroxy-2-naphthoate octaprenyltransferase